MLGQGFPPPVATTHGLALPYLHDSTGDDESGCPVKRLADCPPLRPEVARAGGKHRCACMCGVCAPSNFHASNLQPPSKNARARQVVQQNCNIGGKQTATGPPISSWNKQSIVEFRKCCFNGQWTCTVCEFLSLGFRVLQYSGVRWKVTCCLNVFSICHTCFLKQFPFLLPFCSKQFRMSFILGEDCWLPRLCYA